MGKARRPPPREVTGNPNYKAWLGALPAKAETLDSVDLHTDNYDPNVELTELYGYFENCTGKDKVLSRDEFIKNFTKKVKLTSGGAPLVVKDVEKLFMSSGKDQDSQTMSLHEFMSLMIVIRHGDPEKKLKFSFDMHDTNRNGRLERNEVENMLTSLLSHITDETKRKQQVDLLLKDMMDKKDESKDNKISFEELKKAVEDEGWMKEHLGKGVSTELVVNSMFRGKSSICLVM